jgi:hypothetical protein
MLTRKLNGASIEAGPAIDDGRAVTVIQAAHIFDWSTNEDLDISGNKACCSLRNASYFDVSAIQWDYDAASVRTMLDQFGEEGNSVYPRFDEPGHPVMANENIWPS